MQAIRVLIVDDMPDTRASIRQLLELSEEFVVVGEAGDGKEAIASTREAAPDCVLMDINMPVMDGIAAARKIAAEHDDVAVVMMSVQGEQEYLRKAMIAGARDYLVKPFSADELTQTVSQAVDVLQKQKGPQSESSAQVAAVIGPKGGVGRTTVAANLALALADSGQKTVLLDLNMQFGDLAMTLDVVPSQTVVSLAEAGRFTAADVEATLEEHHSGLRLLAAPDRPEESELVSTGDVDQIVRLTQGFCDWIVVDLPAGMQETLLALLDARPQLLLVVTPDLVSVRNAGQALRLLRDLEYDTGLIKVVLNKAYQQAPVSAGTIERNLGLSIAATIPDDPRAMRTATTRGEPVVAGQPNAPSAKGLSDLAQLLLGKEEPVAVGAQKKSRFSLLRRETKWVTS